MSPNWRKMPTCPNSFFRLMSKIHLKKLCVGIDTPEQLLAERPLYQDKNGDPCAAAHTRNRPRYADELVNGGSLYWVIKGYIQARQRIIDIVPYSGTDGTVRQRILLAPALYRVMAVPHRAFQGWRYLPGADAPPDSGPISADDTAPPPEMAASLRAAGLL